MPVKRTRKRKKKLLDQHPALSALLIENANDAILATDTGLCLTFWNPAAERLYGWKADEVIGRNVREVLRSELSEGERSDLVADMEGGKPRLTRLRQRRKDGTCVEIEGVGIPLRNASGRVIGYASINRDISERLATERERATQVEEQRAQEEKARAQQRIVDIVESISDGFLAIDRDWRITYINRRAAGNGDFEPEELIDQNIWEKLPALKGTLLEKHYREVMANRAPAHFEMHGAMRDQWYDVSVYPSVDGISVYWVDITERKRAEESLQEALHSLQEAMHRIEKLNQELAQRAQDLGMANEELERRAVELQATNKELEAFTYSVSHDLRGPLNLIEQFSQMLTDEYGSMLPEHGQHLLQLIRAHSGVVNCLAEDLLTLTRMQQQAITRRIFSMSDLARQVVDELMPIADRNVEISVGEMPAASGDPLLLKQVWHNLISNALKFTRRCARARIEIGSFEELGRAVYFVRDNGVGFNMAHSDRLFRAFQRLHHPEDFAGNGLGLAIVERVVRRHGGRAWAQAQVNSGASFYFTLG